MALPADMIRSVEVHVVNQTHYDLAVETCIFGTNNKWIDEETPKQGDRLSEGKDAVWGVYTNDPQVATTAALGLVGLGQGRFMINLSFPTDGDPSCMVIPNHPVGDSGSLDGKVVPVTSGRGDIAQFQLIIFERPTPPNFATDAGKPSK